MGVVKISTISAISILVILIAGFFLYKGYRKLELKVTKGSLPKVTKFKCAIGICEIIINTEKMDGKFCEFHKNIQKYHLILVKNNDSMQSKSMMYMSANGQLFKTNTQKNKIYNDLNKTIMKYSKK